MSVRSVTGSFIIEEELARLQSEKQNYFENQLKAAHQQFKIQDTKIKNLECSL